MKPVSRPEMQTVPPEPAGSWVRLSELRRAERGTVVALDRGEPERVRKLLALGVLPGSVIEVEACGAAFVFRLGWTSLAVDARLAAAIHVRRA